MNWERARYFWRTVAKVARAGTKNEERLYEMKVLRWRAPHLSAGEAFDQEMARRGYTLAGCERACFRGANRLLRRAKSGIAAHA